MKNRHIPEKYLKKLKLEGILIAEPEVRFTLAYLDKKDRLLGRDWYKGSLVLSEKRIVLLSKQVKFLNIKRKDERFSQFRVNEDNAACLTLVYTAGHDDLSKADAAKVVIQVFTPQAPDLLQQLKDRAK
ncbi:hypothetical protein ACFVYJ_04900 [Pontibacter sp. JAM-7]|uniref:hypothetical protein n=1 Tax=Pontibacter sp. JAM-7 TaxID=3366581 RepID=UPI003AF68239